MNLIEQKTENIGTSGKFYGNKDTKKRYLLPITYLSSVVIRESVMAKIGSKASDAVEIPSSVMIKPFNSDLFDIHVNQGMFKGKSVEILHDPR